MTREQDEALARRILQALRGHSPDDLAVIDAAYRRRRDEAEQACRRLSFGELSDAANIEWCADLLASERAAAAAEARDKALEEAAKVAAVFTKDERLAKTIRALRGGGR